MRRILLCSVAAAVFALGAGAAQAATPTGITIAPHGTISNAGQTATVHGTVTCTGTADLFVGVTQIFKKGYVPSGSNYPGTSLTCTGSSQPWTVSVDNQEANARFTRGAKTLVQASACDAAPPGNCKNTIRNITLGD